MTSVLDLFVINLVHVTVADGLNLVTYSLQGWQRVNFLLLVKRIDLDDSRLDNILFTDPFTFVNFAISDVDRNSAIVVRDVDLLKSCSGVDQSCKVFTDRNREMKRFGQLENLQGLDMIAIRITENIQQVIRFLSG